jgi:flagellar biosynthetic protein FliR
MLPIPDFLRTAMSPEHWPVFVLITARIGGLMLTAPMWSAPMFPRQVRAALTVVLAALLLPSAPIVNMPEQVIQLPLPVASEMAIGIVIGLAASVLVTAVGLAGEVLSMQMGLSVAASFSPVPELQVPGIAPLSGVLAMLVYLTMGGHLMLLKGLAASLKVLPPGQGFDFAGGAPAVTSLSGQLFACAVSAAAPVMVALLLTNIALAILSKAVPQLNAMMVSFPITVGIGLLMFAASLPIVAGTFSGWMNGLPNGIDHMLLHLQP